VLKKRTLGRTGFRVTEIGFGAWPIGGVKYGQPVPEEEALTTIEAYIEGGGNFLDTARRYGDSERILGDFFQLHGGGRAAAAGACAEDTPGRDVRRAHRRVQHRRLARMRR